MPNWCSNSVTIEATDSESLKQLQNAVDEEKELFNQFVPQPEFEGSDDWYMWNIENWGTKWEGYDGRFNCNDFSSFTFDTAWSPPLPIIKKLAELTGQTFILEYIEEGNFFCGRYIAGSDGETDESYDIDKAPKELLDSLGYEPYEDEELV